MHYLRFGLLILMLTLLVLTAMRRWELRHSSTDTSISFSTYLEAVIQAFPRLTQKPVSKFPPNDEALMQQVALPELFADWPGNTTSVIAAVKQLDALILALNARISATGVDRYTGQHIKRIMQHPTASVQLRIPYFDARVTTDYLLDLGPDRQVGFRRAPDWESVVFFQRSEARRSDANGSPVTVNMNTIFLAEYLPKTQSRQITIVMTASRPQDHFWAGDHTVEIRLRKNGEFSVRSLRGSMSYPSRIHYTSISAAGNSSEQWALRWRYQSTDSGRVKSFLFDNNNVSIPAGNAIFNELAPLWTNANRPLPDAVKRLAVY